MEHRRIGRTDLNVSLLAFGCAPVGSRSGAAESTRALNLAFDQGINFFDTADMYGVGGSEKILGRVFAGAGAGGGGGGGKRRDLVVIASKCGYTFSGKLKAMNWIKPLVRPLVRRLKGIKAAASSAMVSQRSQCFDPAYIQQCVEGSLTRLGTDRIDLYFLHDPPLGIAQRPDVFAMLASLKTAGKIRHYGVSCDLDVAMKVMQAPDTGIAAIQVNANILEQSALNTLLPIARAKGIGIIARQPFSHGQLLESDTLRSALRERGLPTDAPAISALALRFLREFDGVSSIVAGMMRPEHLQANVAALRVGPLSDPERAAVATLAVSASARSNGVGRAGPGAGDGGAGGGGRC